MDIMLADGTTIIVGTFGIEQAGSVKLKASNQVAINNSYITMEAFSQEVNAGNGGDLTVEAADIVLSDDTQIVVETRGVGQAGSVKLAASEWVTVNNSAIRLATTSWDENAGNGGDLTIDAMDIKLADQTQIVAGTSSAGQAGSGKLTAGKQVEMNNSFIMMATSSNETNAGKGGDLTIDATNIVLALSLIHI